MKVYFVQFVSYSDSWIEAGFTRIEDARDFCDELNKGRDSRGGYEVVEITLDSRAGEKRVIEWYCLINPSEGETPENQDTKFMPLVQSRNLRADEAVEFESNFREGYLSSRSTRSPEHAEELLVAEFEKWKKLNDSPLAPIPP